MRAVRIFLDIDWDTFADKSIPENEVESRVEAFLAKPLSARLLGASVCYSPYHSHGSREDYLGFVERLAKRIWADGVQTIQYESGTNELPLRKKVIPSPIYDFSQHSYHRFRLYFKRRGLH